ncbi:DUF6083 domain-containing protein [Streptomyces sp. NPDC002143]
MRSRGRIDLMAEFCDDCWNRVANQMASADGATAAPWPEPDGDDVTFLEPPTCARCGRDIRIYPTVYDRWVSLSTAELPAKDVPPRFRWRLTRLPGRHTSVIVDVLAVRVRAIAPLPGELVIPAHRMLCAVEQAEETEKELDGDG